MSEQEVWKGTLTRIVSGKDNCENFFKELCVKAGKELTEYYDNYAEFYMDEINGSLDEEYYYSKKKGNKAIFKVEKENFMEGGGDIKKISSNEYKFFVSFYNGGAGFNEVLENLFEDNLLE